MWSRPFEPFDIIVKTHSKCEHPPAKTRQSFPIFDKYELGGDNPSTELIGSKYHVVCIRRMRILTVFIYLAKDHVTAL